MQRFLRLAGVLALCGAGFARADDKPAPPPAPTPVATPPAATPPTATPPAEGPPIEVTPIEMSPADQKLAQLLARQQKLFAEGAKENPKFDDENFKTQLQELSFDYEVFLKENPKMAKGYAAFGAFLNKVDMRKQAGAMYLKSNQLDPNQPFVKNQLGNYVAEEGRPLEAVNYFLAAIKLAPKEPLYHYQLGTLLSEARDDFLKSGQWTRAQLDSAMHEGFRQAAELAPERLEFTYRYGESFYDLEKPDWTEALKLWSTLEEKAPTVVERETMRLHAANIFIKMGRFDAAKLTLAQVNEPALAKQKEKLVAQLPESAKK